jgi:hypothetical protein
MLIGIGALSMNKKNPSSILIASLFAISCTSLPPVAYVDISSSLYRQAFGYKPTEISKDYYNEFEYSFARAQFGKSKDVILVLAYINDGVFEWVSSENISVFTKNGRIVKTKGLPHDIDIIKQRWSLDDLNNENIFFERLNFSFPSLYLATYKSNVLRRDNYSYTYLEQDEVGFQITESASIKEIGWKVENEYIYSITGDPVSTSQKIHPNLPRIQLDFYIK